MSEPAIPLMHRGELHEQIQALLLQAIEQTGDARYRTALGIVCGGKAGRPATDDAEALHAIDVMLATGQATTPAQAARFVALASAQEHSIESTEKRIAAKYRAWKKRVIS